MPTSVDVQAGQVYLSAEVEKDLEDRLSRIEGHVRGVRRMLQEHRDCDAILIQIAGIKGAVNQVAIGLLRGHLETCVSCAIKENDAEALGRFQTSLDRVLR